MDHQKRKGKVLELKERGKYQWTMNLDKDGCELKELASVFI